MVVTASLGALLWHGGYRAPAQVAVAALAAAGVAAVRPLPRPAVLRDPLVAGLALMAAANVASLAWHRDRGSVAPALAILAVAVVAALCAPAVRRGAVPLSAVVVALGVTCATAGIAGVLLHSRPLGERIGGLWRAGGTFEYPPALGLLAVCALAAALALHADGALDRTGAIVACAVLTAGGLASFDRVAVLELGAILVVFAARVPRSRGVVAATVAVAVVAGAAALVVSDPGRGSLDRHLRHGPLASRRLAWRAAWDAARDRPWLGHGPGTSLQAARTSVRPVPAEAHNAVLEQAVTAGFPAALGAATVLAAMLAIGLGALRTTDPARLAAGVAATAIALSGLYDFTWSFPPLLLLGALAATACRRAPA
jgi:O-antigen ligase